LLTQLAQAWQDRREEVLHTAQQVTQAMERAGSPPAPGTREGREEEDPPRAVFVELGADYDEEWGGFGAAPKFPPHSALSLMLYAQTQDPEEAVERMIRGTLDAMAQGGLRDHIGGGFHRYSTDRQWLVPHFEKMLYDNAQLIRNYALAYRQTGAPEYWAVVRESCDWALRRMGHTSGGFFAALDADSEDQEGRYYLWDYDEVLQVLGPEGGDLFCRIYNIYPEGNFREELTGQPSGRNLPYLALSLRDWAQEQGLAESKLRDRLRDLRLQLLDHRQRRVRPARDEKILTGWNGLMIRALAAAGEHLPEPAYLEAASATADFLLSHLRGEKGLLRSYFQGRASLPGLLTDYVYLAAGLVDLGSATHSSRWVEEAADLMDLVLEEFSQPGGGFYLTPHDYEDLLVRPQRAYDDATPSGAGLALWTLLALHEATGEKRYRQRAEEGLQALAGLRHAAPRATCTLWEAKAVLCCIEKGDRAGKGLAGLHHLVHSAPEATAERFPVKAELYLGATQLAPGDNCRLAVRVQIQEGWKLGPPADEDESGTTRLLMEPNNCLRLGDIRYPAVDEPDTAGATAGPAGYAGEVWIFADLRVEEQAALGRPAVPLVLEMQACSEGSCLQPDRLVMLMPVSVGAQSGPPQHRALFQRLG
jgi:uncharacterized protein YyaL (SSP411 family)